MDNVITNKRVLVIILIISTVLIFIGIVWVIARNFPLDLPGLASPSLTSQPVQTSQNCTYPISYWRDHAELYPSQIIIGEGVYHADELSSILSGGSQDLEARLRAQLVGAFLNTLAGADQHPVESVIFEAYGWLVQHPEGSQMTDNEREAGARFTAALEAYNVGLAGINACISAGTLTFTSTSVPTGAAPGSATMTPSGTLTLTASSTPSPVGPQPTTPYYTIAPPTRTRTPPPTAPAPTVPSKTPVPPTAMPTATKTPLPTFTLTPVPTATTTASFTPPPPPTSTYTPPPPPLSCCLNLNRILQTYKDE